MPRLPETYDLARGFVPTKPAAVWDHIRDLENWPGVFPGWIASIETDEDGERFTATGPAREKFDMYPHADAENRALDIEIVDELGSADTLRLRLLDMPGGTLVIVAHGKLSGSGDAAWAAKRDAIAEGVAELASKIDA